MLEMFTTSRTSARGRGKTGICPPGYWV